MTLKPQTYRHPHPRGRERKSFAHSQEHYRNGVIKVRPELDRGGVRAASCDYNFGGYCKHIVALLLTTNHPCKWTTNRTACAAAAKD